MPHRLIPLLEYASMLPSEAKLAWGTALAAFSLLADLVTETKGWEDLGIKTLLLAALVFVGRLLMKEQTEHRAEIKELQAAHKAEFIARDSTMVAALIRQAEAIEEQTGILREQTDYYKTVTRNIVEDRLKQTKPNIP